MFETIDDKSGATLQVLVGFLLGLLIGLGCLLLAILLGLALRVGHAWLFPAFNAVALVIAGIIAMRRVRKSSYAQGVVIALALALMLDAACGVAFFP
jgi:hypothetical protein